MEINRDLIEKLAHLSRLNVVLEDTEKLQTELTAIVDWMDKLRELDTDGVEPLIHMSHEVNILRDDISVKTMDTREALMNVPVKDSDYIRVPKFVE